MAFSLLRTRAIRVLVCAAMLCGTAVGAAPTLVMTPPLPAPGHPATLVVVGAPTNPDATLVVSRLGELAFRPYSPESFFGGFPNFLIVFARAGVHRVDAYFDAQARVDGDPHATFYVTVSDAGPVTVVEYFSASLGKYFMTANSDEIAKLDAGTIAGWARTGESFRALPAGTGASFARPVCRYYGLPEAGLDTHFFSATLAECAKVAELWPDRWLLETSEAFAVIAQPWPFTCEPDTGRRVYRLFNNRPDVNHRYTTSEATRIRMIAEGWREEVALSDGDDEPPYAMCAAP